MDSSLHSRSWYRVADLRVRLRGHVRIYRHHFRGELWYVLQDRASGRYHRFTPAAYLVISMMDGERTVGEIWNMACDILGDDALTQDGTIRLIAQLHQADVLHTDSISDADEIVRRLSKHKRRRMVMSFANPMAIRLPLLDPDEFLRATLPLVRPLLTWAGAVVIAGVIGAALFLAAMHWSDLTENIAARVLVMENLLLLFITYPLMKALHELGHGYAVKKWGGEVHEMGIMFLVFMPVPYVDASASAGFQEKWRRALVGAAGIIVELLLAAMALLVWLNVEDGFVRALAFNVMLIGGVSTLLFNGNPLLRFDGYYVLCDLIEIPNLGNRANKYIGYLVQRYAFGVRDVTSPANAPGEPGWFVFYGIAAFCYRMFIATVIILFVASQFFVVGVLLAIWAAIMMIGLPFGKSVWFVLTSPVLRRRRGFAMAVCAAGAGVVAGVLFWVPVPHATVVEGVVWTPGEAMVRSGADGTLAQVVQRPDTGIVKGEPLIRLADPFIDAQVRALAARAEGARQRYEAARTRDPAEANILAQHLEFAEADLELYRQRQAELVVHSPADGRFIVPRPSDMVGRFVRKGELLGYVVQFESPVVRVIVPEDSADLVRQRVGSIEARFANDTSRIVAMAVARELPVLADELPSAALSTLGGGSVYIDPTARDPDKIKALGTLMQLELSFVEPITVPALGGRTYVRFQHGHEAVAWRVYRALRQLFLRQFNV
jgi:putative peptide zinc metalloprotease protein